MVSLVVCSVQPWLVRAHSSLVVCGVQPWQLRTHAFIGGVWCTALATENPTPELLLEKPHGRSEPLISRSMWRHVIVQGCYQLFWLFLIIYGAPAHIPAYK